MRSSIILFFVFPYLATATSVIESWTLPTHTFDKFEMVSQEHNRPIIAGDLLYYATSRGDVVAIQRSVGFVLWRTQVGAPVSGALSYGRSKLFVGNTAGKLTAINAHDGSVSWTKQIPAEWLSPPSVLRDKVCASSSAEEIYCFNEKDGKELWHYSHRGDEKMTIRGTSSPTLFGDAVYQGFADGFVAALGQTNGDVLWTKRLRTRTRFYDIDMPLHVDDKGILVSTFDGNTVALDRMNGNIQWSFPVGSYSGFLVEGDRFYFSGLNGYIYFMDRATGTPLWKTALETGVGLSPVRVLSAIVVATTSDPVYLLKDSTGEILWTRNLGAGTYAALTSSPAEGFFYAMSNYGNLFAFEFAANRPCSVVDQIQLPSAFWPHSPPSSCRT